MTGMAEINEAKIKTLAYANLDCAPDDPDAFDIEAVRLNVMTVNSYPRIDCFVIEKRCTEWDNMNYCRVYNTFTEASDEFKRIIKESKVTKVAVADDIWEYFDDDDSYSRSSTGGDYSPSCPWNAPGMSVSDFIRGVV